jgi:hypothetical protein
LGETVLAWGRARRASPPSTAQFQFRRNVEDFFHRHGKATWGRAFQVDAAVAPFRKAARISGTG